MATMDDWVGYQCKHDELVSKCYNYPPPPCMGTTQHLQSNHQVDYSIVTSTVLDTLIFNQNEHDEWLTYFSMQICLQKHTRSTCETISTMCDVTVTYITSLSTIMMVAIEITFLLMSQTPDEIETAGRDSDF